MSRLEKSSEQFRNTLLNKDIYTSDKPYDSSNSRAKSDGDDHGKGENNGSVGSKTDVIQLNKLLVKNKFSSNKPYDASNA